MTKQERQTQRMKRIDSVAYGRALLAKGSMCIFYWTNWHRLNALYGKANINI